MGRKRRAGDQFAPSSYEEEVVRQTEHQWDTPRKRALFGSDEPDSTTSGSDVVETQDFGLPCDGYAMGQSGLFIENDSPETAGFPSQKLEDTVARLQRDVTIYRKELRFVGGQGPVNPPQSRGRSEFTSTPVPRYSGKSSWGQYRQVFAAIADSCRVWESHAEDGYDGADQDFAHIIASVKEEGRPALGPVASDMLREIKGLLLQLPAPEVICGSPDWELLRQWITETARPGMDAPTLVPGLDGGIDSSSPVPLEPVLEEDPPVRGWDRVCFSCGHQGHGVG